VVTLRLFALLSEAGGKTFFYRKDRQEAPRKTKDLKGRESYGFSLRPFAFLSEAGGKAFFLPQRMQRSAKEDKASEEQGILRFSFACLCVLERSGR